MATESTSPGIAPTKEEGLVIRIRGGDPVAEEELVNTYRRAVLLIATVRTRDRDAANDLSQEILIAVLKALRAGQIRESEKLGAFVQGTARNIINNYLRSRARHPESDLATVELRASDPILLLSLVDGHSLAEVAHRLNLSHEAVRARKSRMVKRMMNKFVRVSQKHCL